MHQEHNFKWHRVAEHLVFIRQNKKRTPTTTDFFPRDLRTQENALAHFARVFARNVQEFSASERPKYPERYQTRDAGELTIETVSQDVQSYLTPDHRRVEDWISRAETAVDGTAQYHTYHGDLADVVKLLLAVNVVDPLLELAQNPRVPLASLCHLSWGHSFGVEHVADWALMAYLFFNVAYAVLTPSQLTPGCLGEMESYQRLLRLIDLADYDAQSIPHRKFLAKWIALDDFRDGGCDLDAARTALVMEHLRLCWELMYRYDMLVKECGESVNWEEKVRDALTRLWNLKCPTYVQ